jgi:hypothetical protein
VTRSEPTLPAARAAHGVALAAAQSSGTHKSGQMLTIVIIVLVIGLILHRIVVPLIRWLIRLLERTIELGIKIGIGLTVLGALGIVVAIIYGVRLAGSG